MYFNSLTCDDEIIFDSDALSNTPDKPKFDYEWQVALVNELSSSLACDDEIIVFDLDALLITPDKPKFDYE